MPAQMIRCEECDEKKRELELLGNIVVDSCEELPDQPGWCTITWHFTQ